MDRQPSSGRRAGIFHMRRSMEGFSPNANQVSPLTNTRASFSGMPTQNADLHRRLTMMNQTMLRAVKGLPTEASSAKLNPVKSTISNSRDPEESTRKKKSRCCKCLRSKRRRQQCREACKWRVYALFCSSIDPDAIWKIRWDVFVVLLVVYVSFLIPVQFAFAENFESFDWFDSVVDVSFMLDIWLNFRTGFPDDTGELVVEKKAIAKRYLKGWFVLDFLASLPIDLFVLAFNIDESVSNNLRLLSGVRALRLVRLNQLWAILKRLKFTGFLKLIRLFFILVLYCHWMACLWFLVPQLDPDSDNWLSYGSPDAFNGGFLERYSACIYFSFTTTTTVGYGDFHPVTTVEYLFGVFAIASGAVVYSILFGSMTALIASLDVSNARHREFMENLNKFMREQGFPVDLQEKLQGYYEFLRTRYQDVLMLDTLPLVLQSKVASQMHALIMDRSPVFSKFNPSLRQLIALKLEQQIAIPEEIIFSFNEPATSLYFVKHGEIVLLSPRETSKHQGEPGTNSAIRAKAAPLLRKAKGLGSTLKHLFKSSENNSKDKPKPEKAPKRIQKNRKGLVRRYSHRLAEEAQVNVLSFRRLGGYFGDESLLTCRPQLRNPGKIVKKSATFELTARALTFTELYFLDGFELESMLKLFPEEAYALQVIAKERKRLASMRERYDDEELLEKLDSLVKAAQEQEMAVRKARASIKEMHKNAFSFSNTVPRAVKVEEARNTLKTVLSSDIPGMIPVSSEEGQVDTKLEQPEEAEETRAIQRAKTLAADPEAWRNRQGMLSRNMSKDTFANSFREPTMDPQEQEKARQAALAQAKASAVFGTRGRALDMWATPFMPGSSTQPGSAAAPPPGAAANFLQMLNSTNSPLRKIEEKLLQQESRFDVIEQSLETLVHALEGLTGRSGSGGRSQPAKKEGDRRGSGKPPTGRTIASSSHSLVDGPFYKYTSSEDPMQDNQPRVTFADPRPSIDTSVVVRRPGQMDDFIPSSSMESGKIRRWDPILGTTSASRIASSGSSSDDEDDSSDTSGPSQSQQRRRSSSPKKRRKSNTARRRGSAIDRSQLEDMAKRYYHKQAASSRRKSDGLVTSQDQMPPVSGMASIEALLSPRLLATRAVRRSINSQGDGLLSEGDSDPAASGSSQEAGSAVAAAAAAVLRKNSLNLQRSYNSMQSLLGHTVVEEGSGDASSSDSEGGKASQRRGGASNAQSKQRGKPAPAGKDGGASSVRLEAFRTMDIPSSPGDTEALPEEGRDAREDKVHGVLGRGFSFSPASAGGGSTGSNGSKSKGEVRQPSKADGEPSNAATAESSHDSDRSASVASSAQEPSESKPPTESRASFASRFKAQA